MLSLLIISNNPKAKLIQEFIQPLIKTEIGLSADFDDGLNEVFEKSPATVIIQERIAGVACDTVVRYMRQMLGNDAPAFIMVHEGNIGASPEKGLFRGFVDLHQADETLVTEISALVQRIISGERFMDAGFPSQSPPPSVRPVKGAVKKRTTAAAQVREPETPLESDTAWQPSILLVEDNLMSQQLTLTKLNNLGYKADIAPNGQKAITALESINYDLVIMDWLMPVMDGFEATARIRDKQSNVLNHDVPIIALTSNKEPGDREKCLEAGMNDYLVKPAKRDYLAEVIEKWLKRPVKGDSVDSETPEASSLEQDTDLESDDAMFQDTPAGNKQLEFPLISEAPISDIFNSPDIDQAAAELIAEQAVSEKQPPKKKTTKAAKAASDQESEDLSGDQALASARIQSMGDDIFENKLLKESLNKAEILEQAVSESTRELQAAVAQLKIERAARKDAEEALKQARIAADANNERLLAKLAERKRELETVNEQLEVEFNEHKEAEEQWQQALAAVEAANERLQSELARQKQELESAAEQVLKEVEEKSKQARIAAASANQQLLTELAERKQELESVNEQLQVEFAEHKDAEEKLHQAVIAAETANQLLQAELAERTSESGTVAEQLQAERAERAEAEEKMLQAMTAAETANQQLQFELAERTQELGAVNDQLQAELSEHKDTEEKLHQAIIAAEAANQQQQSELAERKDAEEKLRQAMAAIETANQQLLAELAEQQQELESVNEQSHAEFTEHKDAEEKLHQALIAAEAAKDQLQAELAERQQELASLNEQSHAEFTEHKDAEEKLHQALIAAEAANDQLQAELAERKQELETAVAQLQVELAAHRDGGDSLQQALMAAEAAKEQLQAELAEQKQELASLNEQMHAEFTEHKDAEEKLHQVVIAAEAAKEQLQAELAEQKQELASLNEQMHAEFTEHKDAEEKLHQAVIAAEAAKELLQAELAERQWTENSLKQTIAEQAQELAGAIEQVQAEREKRIEEVESVTEQSHIEFAEHKDAEEKLHQAVIAAEADKDLLKAELSERQWAESSLKQTIAEQAEELASVIEQLQAERAVRTEAEEKLHLAEITAEAAKEHLQAELAKRKQAEKPQDESESFSQIPAEKPLSRLAMLSAETARRLAQGEVVERTEPEKPQTYSEDILLEPVGKSRSSSQFWVSLLVILVLVIAVAGGAYLFKRKPQALPGSKSSKEVVPAVAEAPHVEKKPAVVVPPPPLQKRMTAAAPAPAADAPLPSFVPASGRDTTYSARAPGWERYVDKTREIRIYRVAGQIKAVQVLAAKNQVVADSFMQTALREVAGSSEYKPVSSERKGGFIIQRNSAGPRAKLTVYRIQSSNKISAFVVHLE